MTVRELIIALTKCDPDAVACTYVQEGVRSDDDTWVISGIDPYEGVVVLVPDPEAGTPWDTPDIEEGS